jgi:hypothetical protein
MSDDRAESTRQSHLDVDVSGIDRIHVGKEMPHATQCENEAWIEEAADIAYLSDGEMWTEHLGLRNLVRKLRYD